MTSKQEEATCATTTATAAVAVAAPIGTRLTIRLPDDFHHHVRDGATTAAVLIHVMKRFGRCLVMPNTKPPITTTEMALTYKQHIETSIVLASSTRRPSSSYFQPLLVLYLTDQTTSQEIRKAHAAGVIGCKYYPAGATTNSEHGVTNIKNCYNALQELSNLNMMLCIHSEVTHGDIFHREVAFIEEIMIPLIRDFPNLKITMEHISTKQAVNYILSDTCPDHVKASITCHHLLYNRNDLLVGGIRPHLYCLPILKGEEHRQALLQAATSGSTKFFLGTDSAPHDVITGKETACGCAGIFTAHAAVELYAEAFDSVGALDHRFEAFCSLNGAHHYGLEPNTTTITLEKKSWTVPESYDLGDGKRVKGLRAGQEIQWSLVEDATAAECPK